MKEIKQKIKDCIFTEFNKELIGDRIKLQNKVNKLQRMIDMINYLQPNEEKEEFVLPEKWCVKCLTDNERDILEPYFYKSPLNREINKLPLFYTKDGVSGSGFSSRNFWDYEVITFEQFKKHVLKK